MKRHTVLLLIILFLASVLRIAFLSTTPHGFHADEASFLVNTQSLVQTGRDEDNRRYPVSLYSYIDPKPALVSYLQMPFVAVLGPTVFAARLPLALVGIASLCIVYLLFKKLSDEKIALIALSVLAISPWHIIVTRGTQEVILSFFFLVLALLLLITLLQKKGNFYLLLGLFSVTSFFSMYSYHSAKVLLPLLALSYCLTYYYQQQKTSILKSLSIVISVCLVLVAAALVQESNSRLSAVSIFSDHGPEQRILQQIYTTRESVPTVILRFFYNKVIGYGREITTEYVSYFSPEFLFLKGGEPKRYIVPEHGLLYLIELPLLIIGFVYTSIKKRKEAVLFGLLLVLAPIPSAITNQETPSIIRSFPMLVGFIYFIAMGIFAVSKSNGIKKFVLLASLCTIYTWQFGYFLIQYKVQAYYDQPWYRNDPYTRIAHEVALIEDTYDRIIVTNDLRPLYSYFVLEGLLPIDQLQLNPRIRDAYTYSIGKFTINRGVCEFEQSAVKTLFIAEVECRQRMEHPDQYSVVKTITYPDGKPVYELFEHVKQ